MRLRWTLASLLVAAAVAVAAVLSASSAGRSRGGHPPVASADEIVIQNYAYHPANLTVRAGTTITVVNRDMTQHTLTANDGAFDTGTLQPGQTKRLTLRRPGTFPYHCQFHAFMTGTIRVIG